MGKDNGGAKKEAKEKPKKEAAYVPKKTNLGDSSTIKRLMDDAVISVLLDVDELGYEEDATISNLKLVIGFTGVAASLVSHVYPGGFPRNWWCLLICCFVYFFTSGIMQAMLTFTELDSILLLKGKKRADGTRGLKLNVSSSFPRFQETYSLGVATLPGSTLALKWGHTFQPGQPCMRADYAQMSWPCNHYFDEDGEFAEDLFIDVSPPSPPPLRVRAQSRHHTPHSLTCVAPAPRARISTPLQAVHAFFTEYEAVAGGGESKKDQ